MLWLMLLVVTSGHCHGSQPHQKTPIQKFIQGSSYFLDHITPYLPRSSLLAMSSSPLEGKRTIARNLSPKSWNLSRVETLYEPNVEFHNHATDATEVIGFQEHGSRGPRYVEGSSWSRENQTLNILLSLMSTILEDKKPVFLHDAELDSLNVLERYLQESPGLPAVILNMSDAALLKAPWLGKYNDACFVHIILFSSLSVIKHFAEELPERVWTPNTLLLVNTNASVNATQILNQANFNYSPFLSLLQPCNQRGAGHYHILTNETFHPHNKITSYGVYSVYKTQTFRTVFPDRFKSFYGHSLQLASWADDFPYLVPGPTLQKTYGICVNMLNEISLKLNFSYEFDKESKASWGELVNGSWIGMVGQVWRREKDLCVNVMSIVEDRYAAVDFSVPYFTDSYSFVIRNPLPPPRWWSILLPFSWQTWVAVLVSTVTVSVIHGLFLQGARRSTTTLLVLRALINQNASWPPSPLYCRLLEGTWVLLAMIISISYTSNLVAYITVPSKPHYLASLKELADSSLTPTMVDYGNFVPMALRVSRHPTLYALGQKMTLIPDYGYTIGFKEVKEGTHALLEGTEFMQYMMILYHMFSKAYVLPETIYPIHVGWIYPKKTPWKHKFDRYIQTLVESGLCRYWKKKLVADIIYEMHEEVYSDDQKQTQPLSLKDLQGAFIIYGLCLAAAIFTGASELLHLSIASRFRHWAGR